MIETKTPLNETPSLENYLRRQIDIAIFGLCCPKGNDDILSWIEKHDDRLSEILDTDEDVKKLARAGEIKEAAAMAKKRLDEWFGYDVSIKEQVKQ